MAKRKRQQTQDEDTLVDIMEVSGQAQEAIEGTGKYILGGLVVIALLVAGYWAYGEFVSKPKQKEAVEQMWQAQNQFAQDSFQLALNNPGGGYPGFLEIIESYGGTDAGNLANYYAGVSYLRLGQYDQAISFLEDFSPDGEVLPAMKYSVLGDAYSEKGDLEGAMSYYKKAASNSENEAITPYYLQKIGYLQQKMGDTAGATATFEQISREFPNSTYSREAEKMMTLLNK